jgi:nucleotide-binding universal stress UspA family protein
MLANFSLSEVIVTKSKVDLTIIGSTGFRGISKFFSGLGSVSRNVSERVSRPILIVR